MSFLDLRTSDDELVRQVLADRPEAFEALVERYQVRAQAIVRALGVDESAAEDVVQQAFLEAFSGLEALRTPSAFGAWFLAIVRNLARKHRAREPKYLPLEAEPCRWDGDPFEAEDAASLAERLCSEVDRLPESLREAVYLYYYEGRSTRKAAAALGISVSAVKVRLLRGRDLLRERLWKALEDSLGGLPSPREWKRRSKTLALLLMTAIAFGPRRLAAETGSVASSLPSSTASSLPGWIPFGALAVSVKKIAVAAAIAFVLVSLAIVVTLEVTGSRPLVEPMPGAAVAAAPSAGPKPTELTPEPNPTPIAVAPEPVAAPASPTGISGTIALEDGTPAARAHVAVLPDWWKEPAATTTAAEDGSYRIEGLAAGKYRIRAWSGALACGPLPPEREWVEVEADRMSEEVDFVLVAGLILRGRVITKADDSPIEGTRVKSFFTSTTTDREGRFELDGMPGGIGLLEARAKGFARWMETIDFRPGDDATLTIALGAGGEIEGTITGPEGAPEAGAEVAVDWGGGTAGATTGIDGTYLFENVPLTPNEIRIGASRGGLFAVEVRVPGLPASESSRRVDLRLDPGFVLRGQVVDEAGHPLEGAEVRLGGSSGAGPRPTDAHGAFAFEGVTEAFESLTASKAGYAPATIQIAGIPALERESLSIPLRLGRFLEGLVVDVRGEPIEGARVVAYGPGGGASSEARSDARGRFRLEDLPEPLRSIRAGKEGVDEVEMAAPWESGVDLRIVLGNPAQIRVKVVEARGKAPVRRFRARLVAKDWKGGPGSTWNTAWREVEAADGILMWREGVIEGPSWSVIIDDLPGRKDGGLFVQRRVDDLRAWPVSEDRDPIPIEVALGVDLEGCVVDESNGEPLPGATVYAIAGIETSLVEEAWPDGHALERTGARSDTSDAGGRFAVLGLPRGPVTLLVVCPGYARTVLPTDTSAGKVLVPLTRGRTLEGKARTAGGEPFRDAVIDVWVDGRRFPEVRTDEEGRWSVGELPAGRTRVRLDPRALGHYIQEPVDVPGEGESPQVELVEPGGGVSGTVTGADGRPITGVNVNVRPTSKLGTRKPHSIYSMKTDGRGSYRLQGLPPGNYSVEVGIDDYDSLLESDRETGLESARREVEVGDTELRCDFAGTP